jgi:hypothetical protein
VSGPCRQDGRLGPLVKGYCIWLLELGYKRRTVRGMLNVLGQLDRSMASEGVEPGRLDMVSFEVFLAVRRADVERRPASSGECVSW